MSLQAERLFVLWHDRRGGFFFKIARLEKQSTSPRYVFRYELEAFQEAHEHGLEPLLTFPDVGKIYRSDHLFPFFENRLMRKSRPDYVDYVRALGLDPDTADEMAILGRSGGERATDSFLLMPEPRQIDKDRSELYFWVTDLGRPTQTTPQNIAKLTSGTALTIGEQAVLLHEGNPVGRLPEYVRALIPQYKPLQGTPELSPKISVVSKNSLSPRRMLLCHLVFRPSSGDLMVGQTGIAEDQEHINHRTNQPRAFIGKRLPQDLESLVVHLCEGNLPTLPVLARPIQGTLFDKPLHDPQMTLEGPLDGCRLRLSGTDVAHFYERMPVSVGRRYETHLELEDGSTVYARSLGAFGTGGHWWCELEHWVWKNIESSAGLVRYWVALLPTARLDYQWMNLGVTTLTSQGLRGLHVPGEPSLTLIQIHQYDQNRPRQTGLAVIVQATDLEGDIERNLYRVINVLTAATGIDEPAVFFGFNGALTIDACFSRGRLQAQRDTTWLPVLPLAAEKHSRDLRWPVPFIRCLRGKICNTPYAQDLHLALVWFRFVLEDPCWEGQLAKMGVVLRLLLQNGLGAKGADWFNPESITNALARLAERSRLNLPPEASAVLDLSHRIAVLGDRGIASSAFPALEDVLSPTDHLGPVKETLRVTFATLLAEAIGYHGPVVGRLHSIRGRSQPHQPRHSPRDETSADRIRQEAEARATFVAGDPDAFPW